MPQPINAEQRAAWKAALLDPTSVQARQCYIGESIEEKGKITGHCCVALYAKKVLGFSDEDLIARKYPTFSEEADTLGHHVYGGHADCDGYLPSRAVTRFVRMNDDNGMTFAEIAKRLDSVLDG